METAFHVLDTDYVQYAVVYGCDDWFWGVFHTQQSWLLSRTKDISDPLLTKAADTLAWEAPWYDQERRWMRIRQGDEEGCKYDSAEETYDRDAQFEAFLDETEQQEQNDNSFTFNTEDFYDDDMTAEEIQAEEDALQQRIQDARPLVEQLEKDAFTFYMAMLDPLNTQRYPDSDKKNTIQIYNEDWGVGGGSILDPFYYGDYMHEVETPAPGEIRNILARGIDALESGKTSVGGYYYIKNIQKKNPNPQGAFLDVQIYTTSFNDD